MEASPTSLVIGDNGSGKSTLIDALTFACFGRPYRKVKKKTELINTINQKDLMVTLQFRRGKSTYLVERGLSPNVFNVYKNGKKVPSLASVTESQKDFEENHLGLSYRSFCQVVVIGSATYTPFMKLSASDRRKLIEDLLDLQILAQMNDIVSRKRKQAVDLLRTTQQNISLAETELRLLTNAQSSLEDKDRTRIVDIDSKITLIETDIKVIEEEYLELVEKTQKIKKSTKSSLDKVKASKDEAQKNLYAIENNLKTISETYKFFKDNTVCPTCTHDLEEDFRSGKLNSLSSEQNILEKDMISQQSSIETFDADIESLETLMTKIEKMAMKAITLKSNKDAKQDQLKDLLDEKEKILDTSSEGPDASDIASKEQDLLAMQNKKQTLTSMKTTLEEASRSLKDDGIKAMVISQYIPILNNKVNFYLETLDFFAKFELNENFEETIRARHIDDRTYDSFSEGEKQRISLALLFAWRDIARMKQSLNTNLLILDETFDSSIDGEGIEGLIEILSTLKDENVMVISHREVDDSNFDRTVKFTKDKNFTEVVFS